MVATNQEPLGISPILRGDNLTKIFLTSSGRGVRRRREGISAVDDVSLTLEQGKTLGIVGESGSGKSTLARLLLGLENPTRGVVSFRGAPIVQPGIGMPRHLRREIQFVAQDPYSNLDPRMNVGRIISEGWRTHTTVIPRHEQRNEIIRLLDQVGIDGTNLLNRLPHEFSGGQRQRIAIARALALRPSVLILDEPISSLDVSVQAQVLRLLQDLQEQRGLSYVFIAHDLSVVEYFADTVAVMYRGRILETGPVRKVFTHPRHPYTELLRRSIPRWQGSGRAATIESPQSLAEAAEPNHACVFYHRCAFRTKRCATIDPHEHWAQGESQEYACHHPLNGGRAGQGMTS